MGWQGSSELAFQSSDRYGGGVPPPAPLPPYVYSGPDLAQHSTIGPRLSPSLFVHVPRRMPPDSGSRAARAVHAPAFTRCLHHAWSRFTQLWVPGLGAQPLDPAQQLPTNALQSQQGPPATFPRWCLQQGPAGGYMVSRPHTLCVPLCRFRFRFTRSWGVQLPLKLGIHFFMWHFSSLRWGWGWGAATLFFT